MRISLTILVVAASLLIAACGSSSTSDSKSADASKSADVTGLADVSKAIIGRWQATGLTQGIRSTVDFGKDGKISMDDGCNTSQGSYTVKRDTVTVSDLVSTRMGCQDQGQNLLPAQAFTVKITDDGSKMTMTSIDTSVSVERVVPATP